MRDLQLKPFIDFFKDYKKVFPEMVPETLDEFIRYCEDHAGTEHAIFPPEYLVLLDILSGKLIVEDIHEVRRLLATKEYSESKIIRFDEMELLLEAIGDPFT